MSAVRDGCRGSIEEPANDSKGCGGVMRVAPIGLYFDDLELADVILEIADDLYEGCQIDAYSDFSVRKNKEWLNKYEEATYKGRK